MKKAIWVGAAALAVAVSAPADAAVTITAGPSFVMPPENVQLDVDIMPGDNVVQGTTNQTQTLVKFISESDNLVSAPQGQAKITPLGSLDGLNNLSFSLTNGGTFTSAEFNILADVGGIVRLSALNAANVAIQSVALFLNPFDATVSASGQNFFGFLADSSTPISSITIQALGSTNIASIGQFRLGGISSPNAIPEPATWAMMLFGFGILGASMRRKGLAAVRGRVNFA